MKQLHESRTLTPIGCLRLLQKVLTDETFEKIGQELMDEWVESDMEMTTDRKNYDPVNREIQIKAHIARRFHHAFDKIEAETETERQAKKDETP